MYTDRKDNTEYASPRKFDLGHGLGLERRFCPKKTNVGGWGQLGATGNTTPHAPIFRRCMARCRWVPSKTN